MKSKLSKKDDWGRRLRSLRRHFILAVEPLVVALAAVFVWFKMREYGLVLGKNDEVVLTGGICAMLFLSWGITAALAVNFAWEKYRRVMACVLPRDKRTFLCLRDDRMPIVIHMFIGSLSFLLLAAVMSLPYEKTWSGIVSVFSSSFVITIYWVVVTQLENPAKSAWLAERIPKEWLYEDVDSFFFKETAEKNEKIQA